MHNFTVYVELNDKGKISESAYLRLKEFCAVVSSISLNLVWIFKSKVNYRALHGIIRFERKLCTYRQLIVHNNLLSEQKKTSFPAKFLINKFNFRFSGTRSEEFEKDCVRISFYNRPHSCMFNSCLGKCVYIKEDGSLKLCPFIDSGVSLADNTELKSIYELFNTESFVYLISESIKRRNICKNGCEYFSLCKGYCPLEPNNTPQENCRIRAVFEAKKRMFGEQSMENEIYKEQVIEQIAEKYKL